jgi:5-methylcytosine-specific restriction endonuclease McrA
MKNINPHPYTLPMSKTSTTGLPLCGGVVYIDMKKYICKSCGKEFSSRKGCKSRTPQYCSSMCFGATLKINKPCKLCGEIIQNTHSAQISNRIYCSKKCQSASRRGTTLSPEWRKALSEGRKASDKCKGENLYNWKGGVENQRRRIKKRYHLQRAAGIIDENYLSVLLKAQRHNCYYCGEKMKKGRGTAIEHLTPISRGGTNEWINLVYSCQSCNSKKRTLTLAEYAIKEARMDWLNNMVQFAAFSISRNKKTVNEL